MSAVPALADRIARVRERVARAATSAGRAVSSVELVAVSKRHPAELVRAAYDLGLRAFGENYAQELVAKAAQVSDLGGVEWHMIGHLQTNKARLVAAVAATVHTIDSPHVAIELGKRAAKLERRVGVLIEVNVAGDSAKTGCSPSELGPVIDAVQESPALLLRGLMTMPPYADDPNEARRYFAGLRGLQTLHGGASLLPELSMGMSHDFEIAIAEGATIVRVGTAIFGERTV
ncbi:MAG TPA: YggS family pyridoxal phosphate-dependent enzyme [Polyangiaceae bacterium]|nr:YggS family pyridoxal phosphate-dependent enzyme [Polyangiaceae bacterium]